MRSAIFVTSCLALAACTRPTPTEIVVRVVPVAPADANQLVVPTDLDEVRLVVTNPSLPAAEQERFASAPLPLCDSTHAAGCYELPISLTIVPSEGRETDLVRIYLEGRRAGTIRTTSAARVGFVTGQSIAVDLVLAPACLDLDCAADDTVCDSNGACMPFTPAVLPDLAPVSDAASPPTDMGPDLVPALPTLTKLELSVGTLVPAFSPDVYQYELTGIPDTMFEVTPYAADDVDIRVDGDDVASGSEANIAAIGSDPYRAIAIEVSASAGARTYRVVATRATYATVVDAPIPVAGDCFGTAIALTDELLAVGSPLHMEGVLYFAGEVQLFAKTATGWQATDRFVSSSMTEDGYFGAPIRMSSSYLAIGSGMVASPAETSVVEVRRRQQPTWSAPQLITSVYGNYFGSALALDGTTLAIGVMGDDTAMLDSGAVEIWIDSGDTWTKQATLKASMPQAGAYFGNHLALQGDTLVVGASGENNRDGAAYVFERTGTTWTQSARLIAASPQFGETLGYAVALEGDRIVLGAPEANLSTPGRVDGRVLTFTRANSVWTEDVDDLRSQLVQQKRFGNAVALRNGQLFVTTGSSLSVQSWTRSGGAWTSPSVPYDYPEDENEMFYSYEIALSSQMLAIAAPAHNHGGEDRSIGRVYVFR